MIRNFEIIGTSSNVYKQIPEFVTKHLEPPLSSASKMRNAVMQGLVKVDIEIIRKTIHRDLPEQHVQIPGIQEDWLQN